MLPIRLNKGRVRALKTAAVAGVICAAVALYANIEARRGLEHLVKPVWVSGSPQNRELVVLLHGFARGGESMQSAARAVQHARPNADLLLFEYPSQPFSNADPFRVAAQLDEQLSDLQAKQNYRRITLVGYSMGAALARKAYLYGSGAIEDGPFSDKERATDRPAREWVKHVDRMVLLAGMNRGWSRQERPKDQTLTKALINAIGIAIGEATGTGEFIRSFERGQPFMANLRLQWLRVIARARGPTSDYQPPLMIQLLGDRDDTVTKDDDRDVTVAQDFIWVPVNNTGHANIVDMDESSSGSERKRKLMLALGDEVALDQLRRSSPVPAKQQDPHVTTVVVVLHGIRDMGEWTSQFEEPLKAQFAAEKPNRPDKLHVHPAGYGFFPMLPFLLWEDRQKNVRWFMDEITELYARFPALEELHFIGHSNGTYILASALQRYASLRVKRVVFVGSVVRRNFNWSDFAKRVEGVRNYVAADDMVVAFFPRLFELPGFGALNPDLGSAGYNGFEDGFVRSWETRFVTGGHGGGLDHANVPSIVDYIIYGKKTETMKTVRSPGPLIDFLSHVCWAIWLVLAALLALGFVYAPRGVRWIAQRWRPERNSDSATVKWGSRAVYAYIVWLLLNTV